MARICKLTNVTLSTGPNQVQLGDPASGPRPTDPDALRVTAAKWRAPGVLGPTLYFEAPVVRLSGYGATGNTATIYYDGSQGDVLSVNLTFAED